MCDRQTDDDDDTDTDDDTIGYSLIAPMAETTRVKQAPPWWSGTPIYVDKD